MLLHNWCEKGKRGAAENWKKPRKNVWPHRINGSSSVLHLHVHTAFLSLFSEPIISISTNSLSGMFSYSHDDDKALWNWGLYPQQFLSVPWGKFLNLLLVLIPSCLFFVTLCLVSFRIVKSAVPNIDNLGYPVCIPELWDDYNWE